MRLKAERMGLIRLESTVLRPFHATHQPAIWFHLQERSGVKCSGIECNGVE